VSSPKVYPEQFKHHQIVIYWDYR